MERILPNTSSHLWAALLEDGIVFTDREREAYALGKLAILLEIETHVRLIEAVSGVTLSDESRYMISNALRDVERSLQSSHDVTTRRAIEEWYDELIARAEADASVEVDASPASSDAAPHSTSPQPRGTDALGRVGRMMPVPREPDETLEPPTE